MGISIGPNINIGRRRGIAVSGGGGYTYYVDSVTGNDANSGRSAALAFATIGALVSAGIAAGNRIALARGSTWYETLTIAADNVTVEAIGGGAKPIIDASASLSSGGWTDSAGRADANTAVYSRAVTTDSPGTNTWINIFEDGAFLANVASLALCQSTTGSYFVSSHTSTTPTIYIHPTGDGNPASNSKAYRYTARNRAIEAVGRNNITVTNIVTQRQLGDSGSAKFGRSARLTGCEFRDGGKHNAYYEDGALLTDCLFRGGYYGAVSFAMAVHNEDTPISLGITFRNCAFEMATSTALAGGIEGHQNVAGSFGAILVDTCTFTSLGVGIDCQEMASLTMTATVITECTLAVRIQDAVTYTFNGVTQSNPAVVGQFCNTNAVGGTIVITNCNLSIVDPNNGICSISHANTTMQISDSTLTATAAGTTDGLIFASNISGIALTVNNCHLVLGPTGSNYRFLTQAPASYTGNNNHFLRNSGEPRFNWGASTYTTLATFQAATSQDAASVVGA